MSVMTRSSNSYGSTKRIAITLICLSLSTALITGISIYVDSASIYEWSKQIQVGPVSMMVAGKGVENDTAKIEAISGVKNVSTLNSSYGLLDRSNILYSFEAIGNLYAMNDDYLQKFPNTFTLIEGRWPENETEVAIPLSLAEQTYARVSWHVNYSTGLYMPTRDLTIVGIYDQAAGDLYSHYFYSSIGVIVQSLLSVNTTITRAYVSVDMNPITPYDAEGSLAYLTTIEKEIRLLYPGYSDNPNAIGYLVTDYLAGRIESYIGWRDTARSAQLSRSSGVLLIVILINILVVQYNIRSKNDDAGFLRARGASITHIQVRILGDLLFLSAISGVLGTLMGIAVSRLALASTSYLDFDFSLLVSSPLLVTNGTVLLIAMISLGIPAMTYLGIKVESSGRKIVTTSSGRLGKVAKGIELIRWDLAIIIISVLLMFAFYTSGPAIQKNPIFSLIIPYIPVPIFLAVGSLLMKGLGRITNFFSRLAEKPFGKIPAALGIRSINRSAKSAAPIIMILVLSITLSCNNAITDVSLPETMLNHAKFTIGADVVFHVRQDQVSRWDEFLQNVTNHEGITSASIVSTRTMFLSTGYSGGVEFVIMNPAEFRFIGYDYFGQRLNDSSYDSLLTQMIENPKGAVLTKDIADEYQLREGDTFQAFKSSSDTDFYTFSVIAVVDALSQPVIPQSVYIPRGGGFDVGSRKIWVNRFYIAEKMNLASDTYNYILAATTAGVNSTKIALDLLGNGGEEIIYSADWSSVSRELDSYVTATSYRMDRSIDSMLSVASVAVLLGLMTIYAVESIRIKRRDFGMMRTLGARRRLIASVQMTELCFLLILTIFLLTMYGPLFIANSLIASLNVYSSWSFIFPIQVFVVVPWTTILLVLGVFSLALLVFIAIIAAASYRTELKDISGNNWSLGCPLMEDQN